MDSKISVTTKEQIEYWCRVLMTSSENLHTAIERTGSYDLEKIREYLIINDL